MDLVILLGIVVAVAVVFAVGVGFQRLHGGRPREAPEGPPAVPRALDVFRERAARVIAPGPAAVGPPRSPAAPAGRELARQPPAAGLRQGGQNSGRGAAMPDLQAVQTLAIPGTSTREGDRPPGLAVTALSAGPPDATPQDVYYVQRNLIALARGVTAIGSGQRAAALSLSAIMTSGLGQASDVDRALRDGVGAANRLVRSISQRDPQYSDMVTTLDVVYVAFDARKPQLHFAHVGTSTIWLQRAGSPRVEALTGQHAIPHGPVLRAVGSSKDLVPDTGWRPVGVGDRIFLTTATPSFTCTEPLMNGTLGYWADRPLHDAVAALAERVQEAGVSEEIMIVGAEMARPGMFLA